MPFLYLSGEVKDLRYKFHAFTDYDSTCLELLKAYDVDHLFSDLLLGYAGNVVRRLTLKQTELRDQLKTFPKGSQKSQAKRELVQEFKQFCLDLVGELEVAASQPCLKHGCHCLANLDVTSAEHAWVESICPSCVHWSSQGSRVGWLGHETLSLLCWAMAARVHCPDLVFLECTPQLDLEFLTTLSGGRLQWNSAVVGPRDVGLPVAGSRVWAIATGGGGKLQFSENPFADEVLTSCVFRRVVMSPMVFMCASTSEVNSYLDEINRTRDNICPHPRGKRYRAEDYIGSSSQCRLDMHRCVAANARLRGPSLSDVDLFYDISHNVTWSR